ncbi:MAG: hypothetical protein JRF33_22475, partial [Deltaproteobacteria bacterium]|nr:hypothetical protein [Deltaproteobacteria bacterium]
GYFLDIIEDTAGFPFGSLQATLYPAGDDDNFRARCEDTPAGVLRPTFMLTDIPAGSNYDLYVWGTCLHSADDPVYTCLTGEPRPTWGGCQSRNLGNQNEVVMFEVNCLGTTNDTVLLNISVERISGPWNCEEYTLYWGDS